MKLSTGKELTFSKLDNGAVEIDQELTEREWEEYCNNHVHNNTSAEVNSRNTYILDKKREARVMRLFVLSSGYVAAFTNSIDETYWGSAVIPLGFGAEVHAQKAVDIISQANPENLVVFSGGLAEYTTFTSLDR